MKSAITFRLQKKKPEIPIVCRSFLWKIYQMIRSIFFVALVIDTVKPGFFSVPLVGPFWIHFGDLFVRNALTEGARWKTVALIAPSFALIFLEPFAGKFIEIFSSVAILLTLEFLVRADGEAVLEVQLTLPLRFLDIVGGGPLGIVVITDIVLVTAFAWNGVQLFTWLITPQTAHDHGEAFTGEFIPVLAFTVAFGDLVAVFLLGVLSPCECPVIWSARCPEDTLICIVDLVLLSGPVWVFGWLVSACTLLSWVALETDIASKLLLATNLFLEALASKLVKVESWVFACLGLVTLMAEFCVPPVIGSCQIQSGKSKNLVENDTLHGFRFNSLIYSILMIGWSAPLL